MLQFQSEMVLLWLGLTFVCSGYGITDLLLPAENITLEELIEDIDRGNAEKWMYEWVRFKTKVDKVYDQVLYLETGRADFAFLILGAPYDKDDRFKKYKKGKTYRFRVQITGIDPVTYKDKTQYSWYIISTFDEPIQIFD